MCAKFTLNQCLPPARLLKKCKTGILYSGGDKNNQPFPNEFGKTPYSEFHLSFIGLGRKAEDLSAEQYRLAVK